MCGQGQEDFGERECMKENMRFLGLQPKWVMFRDVWRGKRLTLAWHGTDGCFTNT